MALVDMSVKDFISILGSDAPAPGGGSASALSAAQGISLTKMVAELTVGKKRYEEFQELAEEVLTESRRLQKELLEAIDKDAEAFNAVSAVFKMPRKTDEEKTARHQAMQKGLKTATHSPIMMMQVIVEAIEITHRVVGKSNPNVASDLGVSALNLKSGLQGAWLNVSTNLSGIKDQDFVADKMQLGQELLNKGSSLADEIYHEVLEQIK